MFPPSAPHLTAIAFAKHNSTNLSTTTHTGGEKQRLAVSRLILKDPPLLFFDEATSALDTHTEQALLGHINSILKDKNRTSVFVAHRLRTIYDCDLIIVLRGGQVAESGTHEELVDRGGLYSELWSGECGFFAFAFLHFCPAPFFFWPALTICNKPSGK
jgi:ABC-type multidrug transport system fused ATPase/permease subunit